MGTGRKPFTTHDVTPFDITDERLKPSEQLGQAEKRAFWSLVTQAPAGQFRETDRPLINRWCELTVLGDRAAAEMATNDLVTPDGRPSPWISIHERAVKGLVALSLRLRLSPQSRMDKSPKTQAVKDLSYYERMAAEDDHGEAGDGVVGDRS